MRKKGIVVALLLVGFFLALYLRAEKFLEGEWRNLDPDTEAWIFQPLSEEDKFPVSQSYPLRVFVDGDLGLRVSSDLALAWWEKKLFGYPPAEKIAVFVEKKKDADLIIVVGKGEMDDKGEVVSTTYRVDDYNESGQRILPCFIVKGLGQAKVCPSSYTRSAAVILLAPWVSWVDWDPTLRHEIGHAVLGLSHNRNTKSVMHPTGGIGLGVGATADDLAAAKEYLRRHGVSVP